MAEDTSSTQNAAAEDTSSTQNAAVFHGDIAAPLAAIGDSGRPSTAGQFVGAQPLIKFYADAIKSYKSGEKVENCPLCHNVKRENKDGNAHPSCHIFPRALLDAYKKIHCPADDHVFIHYGEFKSSNCISHHLFCHDCEASASDEEQLLRNIYLQIMVRTDGFVTITVNEAEKLKHILATIMFRGLLFTSKDMDVVGDTLVKLQQYCVEKKMKKYEEHIISEHVIIYLLPNIGCYPKNPLPTHILDLQLRNPCLTRIIVRGRSIYLYTKFDCFHCLLPILPVQDGIDYENVKGVNCLRRLNRGSYHLLCDKKLPDFILRSNVNQVGDLVRLYTTMDKTCHCVIGKTFPGSTSRTNPKKNKGMEKDLQEKASMMSPIRSCGQNARIVELERDKKALTEKLKEVVSGNKVRLKSLEKEGKRLKAEEATLSNEIGALKRNVESWKNECAESCKVKMELIMQQCKMLTDEKELKLQHYEELKEENESLKVMESKLQHYEELKEENESLKVLTYEMESKLQHYEELKEENESLKLQKYQEIHVEPQPI